MRTYLSRCRLVLPEEIIEDSSILIEDGIIKAINPENSSGFPEIDLQGKLLLPGMIDLHCDALEKEVEPRPNVQFPFDYGCAQADKRNAAAGITTVFHALSFAGEELGVRNNKMAAKLVQAMHEWSSHGLVDNRIHCRYEITDEDALPIVCDLLEQKKAHLVSVMDHTPGQGQFKDISSYRIYLAKTYKKSEKELDRLMEKKRTAASGAFKRMKTIAKIAHKNKTSLASHDDDSPDKIKTMRSLGTDISEFPVNLEAAASAGKAGMFTVFGAPNILRGKSQSGSMRAIDAIHAGVVDCLCSDYAPAALIVSIFKLSEQSELSLPEAVKLVTKNPAAAAGLQDRGEIKTGRRADLIAVDQPGNLPQVCRVWVNGVDVFKTVYDHG